MRFYLGGRNVINKKGLFYAKFFEFEEFSIVPFFCSSIQPQHTVIELLSLPDSCDSNTSTPLFMSKEDKGACVLIVFESSLFNGVRITKGP